MEPVSDERQPAFKSPRISGKMKLIFAIALAIVAGAIGYIQIFRSHPAQSAVEKAFGLVEDGDIDKVMESVDPQGQLGTLWYENEEGMRDKLISLMDRYRLDFNSLKFNTRAEGDLAEVELTGGRATIYEKGQENPPAAVIDLGEAGLIFEVEKKGDRWLIEGTNYDISQFLSGEQLLSPF